MHDGGGGFSGGHSGHSGGGFGGHSHNTSSHHHHHHNGFQSANDAYLYNNLGQYRQHGLNRRGVRRPGGYLSAVFSLLFALALIAMVVMLAH